jgi:hypothetical protein
MVIETFKQKKRCWGHRPRSWVVCPGIGLFCLSKGQTIHNEGIQYLFYIVYFCLSQCEKF